MLGMQLAAPGRRVFRGLILIDSAFILLNLFVPTSVYSLDEEANLPTWYSSAKLLALASLALWLYFREGAAGGPAYLYRALWLPVGAVFLMLSIDETATLHERTARWAMDSELGGTLRRRFLGGDQHKDAFIWPIIFAPFVLALLFFLIRFFVDRFRRHRKALALSLGGCALFGLAVLLEGWVAYSSPDMQHWESAEADRYVRFTVAEEAAELYGTPAILGAFLSLSASLGGACPHEEDA